MWGPENAMGAFAERVTRRFRIDRSELAFIERLEAHPVPMGRGQTLAQDGDPADRAFVLLTGWVMSTSRFPDGSQQIRRLHFPGDLLAMPSVPMRHYTETLEALSDGVVAPFSKRLLAELFNMPRLAGVMYMFAQAERVTIGDRLTSMGHDSARARLAFLLVDILHRLRSTDATVENAFYLHLTREQMAHATGITPVHASRTWNALLAEGLIACKGRTVTIVDEQQLARIGHYADRDDDLDFGWLRAVVDETGAASGG